MSCIPCFVISLFLCFITSGAMSAETAPSMPRKLIAAVQSDFPPTYSKNHKTNKPEGFAIDIMDEVARRAGIRVEYVFGRTWEESQEMVLDGRADIIPSLIVDETRKRRFAFSHPLEKQDVSYVVRNDDRMTDLKENMRIGVMRASIAQVHLQNRSDILLVPSDSLEKLLFDLLAGKLDRILVHAPNMLKLAQDSGTEDRIRILEPPVINGIRAMALRPGETELLERLNREIDQFVGTPEYRQIYFRWWGKPRPFWTTGKVLWSLAATVLICGLCMGYWRYASVLRLNGTQRQILEQLEESRKVLLQSEEQSMRHAREADQERARSLAILESMHDGISIQDRDYRVLYQNSRLIKMVGEHRGEQCFRAYQHRDEVCAECPLPLTFKDSLPHTSVMTLNSVQDPVNIEILSSPLFDEQGEVSSVIASVRDITGRKQLEDAIKESEQFLRTIIDTEPECVKLLDEDGCLLMMNNAGLKMIGADSLEQVKNASVYPLVTPEYRDDFIRLTKDVFRGIGGTLEFEIVGLTGRRRWLDTRAVPLRNGRDEIVSLLGITRDVTERRLAEQELVNKQKQLEELNEVLINGIDEAVAELRKKDQMLLQQNRLAAMGEMINNIAHQWRQPLNNIGLILQNLQLSYEVCDLTPEELKQEVSKAMDVIMHMSGTIDDFRNFFRQDKQKRGFVINKVVARSLDFIASTLQNSNIRVTVTAAENVSAFGYQNEYAQALLNILSNARDALIERAVADACIEIGINSENGRSVVTISDNGGGIPENVLPRIFDPYFTTKEPGKGTGIGLYMSKVIIEQNMGGRLTAQNTDGGAEFRIEV